MHPRYLGDYYDIVKRELMRGLLPGERWTAHPMYFDYSTPGDPQRAFPRRYASFLRVRLLDGDIWDRDKVVDVSARCHGHLFLDPDHGIWLGKNLEPVGGWMRHLKGSEVVQIVRSEGRESSLTLVFADTRRDNFNARHRRITEMLSGIQQRHQIHGNGYVSSLAFVWLSMDGDLVEEATRRLLERSGLPRWRMADSGNLGTQEMVGE